MIGNLPPHREMLGDMRQGVHEASPHGEGQSACQDERVYQRSVRM